MSMNESSSGAAPDAAPRKLPRIILAPGDPVANAAADAIRMAGEALATHQPAALAGDPEAVHQMRIATRRLRVTVELFGGTLSSGWFNAARRELKWLGGVIGALRDCDVIGQLISDRAGRLAPDLAAGVDPIRQTLSARRLAVQVEMRRALESQRYHNLLGRIAAAPAKKLPPAATVKTTASELLAPIARRVDKAGARLVPESDSRAFHKLRIRIKRLRYSFEMLAEAGDGEMKSAAKRLRKMQDLLGEQHDAMMAAGWLREFAAASSSAPALVASGALIESFDRRESKLAAHSLKRWRKLARGRIIRDALKEVAHSAVRSERREAQADEAA